MIRNLQDFVKDITSDKPEDLNIHHTTFESRITEIAFDGKICAKNDCKFFNSKVVYGFYGKPAYNKDLIQDQDKPINFIFENGEDSDLLAIYPFDTGGYFTDLQSVFSGSYTKSYPSKMDLLKVLELKSQKEMEALIFKLYGNSEKYLKRELYDFELNDLPPPIKPFISILKKNLSEIDDRLYTFELIFNNFINLKVKYIVLPASLEGQTELILTLMEKFNISQDQIQFYIDRSGYGTPLFGSVLIHLMIEKCISILKN